MAVKNKGLGKGLGVLFGDAAETVAKPVKAEEKGAETLVKIGLVEPDRNQPRKDFAPDSLKELSDSIREHGIIQPIIVQKKGAHYQIVTGERRWRAAKLAGLKEVPVLIREYSDENAAEIALIENIQRRDLNPIEEAEAYRRLLTEFSMTQEKLAERISKNRVNIANSLRLLKLPEEVQTLVKEGKISTGHAKVLLSVEDPSKLTMAAREVASSNMSVRDTEKLVKSLEKTPEAKKPLRNKVAYDEAEHLLSQKLGTRVRISRKAENSGKIEISFSSLEDFERITDHIR